MSHLISSSLLLKLSSARRWISRAISSLTHSWLGNRKRLIFFPVYCIPCNHFSAEYVTDLYNYCLDKRLLDIENAPSPNMIRSS